MNNEFLNNFAALDEQELANVEGGVGALLVIGAVSGTIAIVNGLYTFGEHIGKSIYYATH